MKDFMQEALQMEMILRQRSSFRKLEILMWKLAIFEASDADLAFNNELMMLAMSEYIDRTTKVLMRSFEIDVMGDK
jgi:hypothetical protein